jgi:putative hydrolases of HD superfamily
LPNAPSSKSFWFVKSAHPSLLFDKLQSIQALLHPFLMETLMSNSETNLSAVLNFFFAVGNGARKDRGWSSSIGFTMNKLGGHVMRTAQIGAYLATQEGANPEKTVYQILFHDNGELLGADPTPYQRSFIKVNENKALNTLCFGLPIAFKNSILGAYAAYKDRQTLESKCSKDADILDTVFDLKESLAHGCKYMTHEEVQKSLGEKRKKYFTQTARHLHDALVAADDTVVWDWFLEGPSTFKTGDYGK